MRFVRENLFLVVLVAVVVVVGGVMIFLDLGLAEDVKAHLERRETVAGDLAGLARKLRAKNGVNQSIIDARKERALEYRRVMKRIEDVHVAWNLRRYPILQLPIYKEGSLLLERGDIRDWVALLRAFRDAEPETPSHETMRQRLWQRLDEETRKKMPPPRAALTAAQRTLLLAGLNDVLQGRDFFVRAAFPDVGLPEEARADEGGQGAPAAPEKRTYHVVLPEAAAWILRKRGPVEAGEGGEGGEGKRRTGRELTDQEVQRLNRLVLEAFYPALIVPCQVPAFPIDKEQYQKHALQFHFQQQYHRAVGDLVARLEPTSAPSLDEIELEVERWSKLKARWEQRRSELKAKATGREEPGRPGGVPPPDMRGLGEEGMPGRGRLPGRPTRTAPGPARPGEAAEDEPEEIDPKTYGEETAKMRKAREGCIYAGMESFVLVFPLGVPETNPPNGRLWQAQVSLWVMQDVVSAILRTNQQVFARNDEAEGDKKEERHVLTAAVKHLIGVKVMAELAGPATARPAPARRGMVELPPMGEESMRPPTRAPSVTAASVAKAPTLTQRAASAEHEIARYSFVVIMPPRHVVRLQRNLLALNYHVILNVTMVEVPEEYRAKYYYGVEPIMQVRIDAELPLLSVWTRGKWDSHAKQWLTWNRGAKPTATTTGPARPTKWVKGEPLMPVDYLDRMIPRAAWRPEDQQRVGDAAAAAEEPGEFGRFP